jgi:trehalose 6-phosphate synthase
VHTWNAESLRSWLESVFGDESLVVLANREPFQQEQTPDGRVIARRSSGGLVTALEPLMRACTGIWVAQGTGSADWNPVDACDGPDVPPAKSRFRVRRVRLSDREERGYYYGFANEGLWPFCHRTSVQPVFRTSDFRTYSEVNARFANAVCKEIGADAPVVLVQDYHFALAPRMIRTCVPHATIVAFWHVPFPNPRDYERCPWGRQLLEGLLGSSIVGFQTAGDCRNFMDAARRLLGAPIDRQRNAVVYGTREVLVRAYPVSVAWPSPWAEQSPPVDVCRATVRCRLGLPQNIQLVVGVDRLDYTKGINEKFLAVERLLELRPEFRERFVLVQIAEPSRACLPAYREARRSLLATAERVNLQHATACHGPVIVLENHYDAAAVFELLRAADVFYVGSLHDGMNLVAKEFVVARDDERGVLILSEFTGAARELRAAVPVNPFTIDEGAKALAEALNMSPGEQRLRMRAMRAVVERFNSYRWAADMLADAARLRSQSSSVPSNDQSRQAHSIEHSRLRELNPGPIEVCDA